MKLITIRPSSETKRRTQLVFRLINRIAAVSGVYGVAVIVAEDRVAAVVVLDIDRPAEQRYVDQRRAR